MDSLRNISGENLRVSKPQAFRQEEIPVRKAGQQDASLEAVDLSFTGSLPLIDKGKQGAREKPDTGASVSEKAQPPLKPFTGESPSLNNPPVVLVMDGLGSSGSSGIGLPGGRVGTSDIEYAAPAIQTSTQKLINKVLDIKSRGKAAQPDEVLSAYQDIKEKAGETGSLTLKLLCSRFQERAGRAAALKEARAAGGSVMSTEPSTVHAAAGASLSDTTSLVNAFMNADVPYLGDEVWNALADKITHRQWVPGFAQIEMLKARVTVPSGTAGQSILGKGAQDDSDFRGAVKVLQALKAENSAFIEGMTLPDGNGSKTSLASSLTDRILTDPQVFSMLGIVSAVSPPQGKTGLIHDVYDLVRHDRNVKTDLLNRVENACENSRSIETADKESIMALAVILGLGKDGAETERLNAMLSKHLPQKQNSDSMRMLLSVRRREVCTEMAERLKSGELSPDGTLKALTDIVVMTFCTGALTPEVERALSPFLPALQEGLASLKESPDYGRRLAKLVESAEEHRTKVGAIGGMDLPDLARLYLLVTVAREDKALIGRLQKLLDPEVRKTNLKGQNASIAALILTDYKRNIIADTMEKLQSEPLSRSARLGLYKKNCELSSTIYHDSESLKKESLNALVRGLVRDPSSGLAVLTERFNDPDVALKVYSGLAPGAESDEDVASALGRFLSTLDHSDENLKKLEFGNLPRSERLSILDASCEPAHILQTQEASALKRASREALCRGLQSNPSSGLADLPSRFKNPDIAIRVYRTLAPGAERTEEIAVEWSRFRDILDLVGGESKLKDATTVYRFWKQQEAQGKTWKEVMEHIYTSRILGQDYRSLLADPGSSEALDSMVIEDFDDDMISIGGITLSRRRDTGGAE